MLWGFSVLAHNSFITQYHIQVSIQVSIEVNMSIQVSIHIHIHSIQVRLTGIHKCCQLFYPFDREEG